MVSDPIIIKKIGKNKVYIHKSHKLPEYRKQFPFYDQALPRICQTIKEIDNDLTLIDVGANIGDSIALITDKVSGNFLCIEGDQKYLPVLKKNIAKFKSSNIEIEPSYCGDGSKNTLSIINENGTARLIETKNSEIKNIKTLDQMINEHPKFRSANILKIDTDGFEINVLRGAKKFITSSRPIIYTEFTPELYDKLDQKYSELIEILIKYGYTQSMFYDNFGRPIKKVNLNDKKSIISLVSKINKKNIYYYDILAIPNELKSKYQKIFEQELFSHILKLNKLYETKKTVLQNTSKELDNLSTIVKTKDKELDNLSTIVKTKDKKLENLSTVVKTKDKELDNLSTIIKTKDIELNNFQVEFNKIISERNNIENRLREIYNSFGWRILRHLYLIRDFFFPKNNLIKKFLTTNILKIKNIKIRYTNILHRLNTKKNINIKSRKIVYIGHSYHIKTKSTAFLIEYLKKHFKVTEVIDESWLGKKTFPDLSFIDKSYVGVIFFQNIPDIEVIKKIDNDNIIFFPMYDNVGGREYNFWKKYIDVKIINFSKTLHQKLISWGFESYYLQYFPKPLPFIKNKTHKVFFWQRTNAIDINLVEKLLGNLKTKIHIHQAIDPNCTFVKPTKEQEKKFNITYSNWFNTREEMQKKIQECDIYIAPREYEGIGMSFLEAMSMGKAVVAINNPTMNEYIINNQTGYLFDKNNLKTIDFYNISNIRKNSYNYMKNGYKNWEKEKNRIIYYISKK